MNEELKMSAAQWIAKTLQAHGIEQPDAVAAAIEAICDHWAISIEVAIEWAASEATWHREVDPAKFEEWAILCNAQRSRRIDTRVEQFQQRAANGREFAQFVEQAQNHQD